MVWAQNLDPREATQELFIKRYVNNLTIDEQLAWPVDSRMDEFRADGISC